MIKKILMSSLLLLSLHSFAQESTASPYSFYGIGDFKFKGTVENKSMGGLGILPDSIHINMQNPASLSEMKLTLFSVAGTYNSASLKTASASEKTTRTALDYIAMAFPAGKLGLSLGMMPISSVGYKMINFPSSTNPEESFYTGIGGVNRVFVGAGYQITPKLSVGLDLGYNFGEIETSSTVFKTGVQLGSREVDNSKLNGINFNSGLIYKTKIDKFDFVSSATFSPSSTLKSNNTRNTSLVRYAEVGVAIPASDPVESPVEDSEIKIGSKFAFGSGIGQLKKWFVGFESTFQGKSDYNHLYTNAEYESASKFALGGYYVPNYNSFSNYFSKITYRAGLRHENTGLVVNSESIKDSALTLGLGLPISGSFSNINVGVEFGKKGTNNAGLVKENYINLSIGLSFNDKWFVKRKFD